MTILKYQNKKGSLPLKKLLISAISNWQQKNKNNKIKELGLYIKKIKVDPGKILKKIKAAPQGKAHKIRKKYNHITIILEEINKF